MAKYPVYCIRDVKVGFDTQFLVQQNEAAAKRGFSYMINNPSGLMNFVPSDYELYHIAEFDTDCGQFDPVIPAEFVIDGGAVFLEKS